MKIAPPRPGRLSLWMHEHGRPSQMRVRQVQTGCDTAETEITLFVLDDRNHPSASVIVTHDEIGQGIFASNKGAEVCFYIGPDFVVDWTPAGRTRLDDWLRFNFENDRDLQEYKRLKKIFERAK